MASQVELLVERVTGEFEALAFIRASHAPKPGSRIRLSDDIVIEVLARQDDLTQLRFPHPVLAVLDRLGRLPLPPYIEHTPTAAMKRATRPCTPAGPAQSRRRPPACISTMNCWRVAQERAS